MTDRSFTLAATAAIPSSSSHTLAAEAHFRNSASEKQRRLEPPEPSKPPLLRSPTAYLSGRSGKDAKRKISAPAFYSTDGGPSRKRLRKHDRPKPGKSRPGPSPTFQAAGEARDEENAEAEDKAQETIQHLNKQLRDACDEVSGLKWALDRTEAACDARHMLVRQNMLFDTLLKQEKASKELESERARCSRIATSIRTELQTKIKDLQATMDEMKKAHEHERKSDKDLLTRMSTQLAGERNRFMKKVSEIHAMQSQLDHCQALLRVADDDLTELQRIGNEEKASHEKKSRGLPPAYGSLDDIDSTPPWGRHEDGGKLEVANIKHTVRDRFMRDLSRAQNISDKLREAQRPALRATAGSELFRSATIALAEASISMMSILDKVEDVQCPLRKRKHWEDCDADEPQQPSVSKRAFVANRIAKLIIDFCWKILACFDVRHLEVSLGSRVKAETGQYMRSVDDTLLKALEVAILSGNEREDDPLAVFAHEDDAPCMQCCSTACNGHCERMNELQYFLTIIKAVSGRLDKLTAKDETSPYFSETFIWLMENVETERRLAANAQLPPTRQMSPADEEGYAATPAAAVTSGRSICSQHNRAEVIADAQERVHRLQQDSLTRHRTQLGQVDITATPAHYQMATITNPEHGTQVPGIMVRTRGSNGQAEGEMFPVELGRLDESVHVVANRVSWD